MAFLIGILKIIIILGTLVTIHELGHFLVAKACNVKVHKFAIGFGPKIIAKKMGETEYALRAIPFGGFVQLEGEDRKSEDERAFNNKPVWQRMLIIVAGATVNIIFSLILYHSICMQSNIYTTSTIKNVDIGTVAYNDGLRAYDNIIAINGKHVKSREQVLNIISNSKSNNLDFLVERNSQKQTISVTIPEKQIGMIGVAFDNDGNIVYVQSGGVAQISGVFEGDKIVSINGFNFDTVEEYTNIIKENAGNSIELVIEREGKLVSLNMVPVSKKVKIFDVDFVTVYNLNFFENFKYAVNETSYYFAETLRGFLTLITGKTEDAAVMGPIGIAGEITKTQSLVEFFYLMSAISLSLGIFNLAPIPGLDGGKFLFLIIEWIRKKPMNENTEIAWQLAGFSVIITIAIIVSIKDVINLF